MTIAVSNFVKRQTPESEFSHFTGTWEELQKKVQANYEMGRWIPGYRDGVVLVIVNRFNAETTEIESLNPQDFYSNIVQLQEGDALAGEFKARQPGEEPRKSTWLAGDSPRNVKVPAMTVQIVLYRHDVLVENNEQSCDADWEIISINASPTPYDGKEMPMPPGTLMANHFQLSGGTATKLTDSEFVVKLRESVLFWKDKMKVAPKP